MRDIRVVLRKHTKEVVVWVNKKQSHPLTIRNNRVRQGVSRIVPFMPLRGFQRHGTWWELARRSGSETNLPSHSTSQTSDPNLLIGISKATVFPYPKHWLRFSWMKSWCCCRLTKASTRSLGAAYCRTFSGDRLQIDCKVVMLRCMCADYMSLENA